MAEDLNLKFNVNVDGKATLKSLKAELKEAQGQALAFSRIFGELSPQAIAAAKRVAELKDEIADLNERVDLMDPGKKFEVFGNAVKTVAGGFAAAQGALAVFGAESKDLEKTLVKLQGAMALSEGLSTIADSWKDFQRLGAVVKTQVVNAFTTLKGAIIATGLGALAVAIGLIISNFDKIEVKIQELFPAFEGFGKLFNKVKAIAMGALKGIIETFKVLGEIVVDVFSGDFSGAIDTAKGAGQRIGKAYVDGFNEEVADQIQEAARKATEALIKRQENDLKILRSYGETRRAEADKLELQIAKNKVKILKDGTKEEREAQAAAFADLKALQVKQAQEEGARQLENLKQRQALQMQALQQAGVDLIGIQEKQLLAQLALQKKYGLDTRATLNELAAARSADVKARFDLELKALLNAQTLQRAAMEAASKDTFNLKQQELEAQLQLYIKYGYSLKEIQEKQAEEELERRQKLQDALSEKVYNHEIKIQRIIVDSQNAAARFADESERRITLMEEKKQLAYDKTVQYIDFVTNATAEASEIEKAAALAGALAVQYSELSKQDSLKATSNILLTSSRILGQQTAVGKGVAIAAATIDTYKAAQSSYSALSMIPIVGPALGAVAAAAAIVAGIARVKAITRVKVPGAVAATPDTSSAISGAANGVSLPQVNPNISNTLVDQAVQQNSNLRQPQRVFVVESDITDTQERVASIEANAQF